MVRFGAYLLQRVLTLALTLGILGSAPHAALAAVEKIFWTSGGNGPPGFIESANGDGSGVATVLATATVASARPAGIALDQLGGKLYWMDMGSPGSCNSSAGLRSVNLDGSGAQTLASGTGFGLGQGVAVDSANGKVYWGATHASFCGDAARIRSANLDGSGTQIVVSNAVSFFPGGLAVDASGGKLYWADSSSGSIRRANLDGSGVQTIVFIGNNTRGVAVDSANGHVYFTAARSGGGAGTVHRANLDGSGLVTLVTGLVFPWGIALDVEGGKMYWADINTGKIQSANLDGSNVQDVVTGLVSPQGIALEIGPLCFVIDAIDDQFSVINDGTTADFFVLQNDECRDDPPISVVELPGDLLPDRGGSATTDGAKVNYTPAAGFIGFEEFTYTAQDAGLDGGDDPPTVDQDTAVVVVDVLPDITPDAVDDMATTLQNQATIIDVLENDSLGNAPNEVAIETAPANGSATLQTDDTIRYSPNFNFFGEDSFEYRLTDANGDSDVATVTVGVFFVRGQVPIDIMPADPGNNVNLRAGQGAAISVAILSVGEFFEAPNLIDPLSLKFGPRQANIWGSPRVRDVDGDGDGDLVVQFLIQQTGIACGDTEASLSGRTFDFQSISGSDAINTFNCPRIRKRY